MTISHYKYRQSGLTLVELMIALAIGSVILGAMAMLFAVTSQTREELERQSRQIENGRFAIERIRDEARLAGFFGEVLPRDVHYIGPASLANAIDPAYAWDSEITAADSAAEAAPWTAKLHSHIPTGIWGMNDVAAGTLAAGVVTSAKAGTDLVVFRRASTAETAVGAGTQGVFYLQNSFCTTDALPFVNAQAPASGAQAATFNLMPRYCATVPVGSPAQAPLRRSMLTVFYVATCNDCSGSGDGIPTLKRAEYVSGTAMSPPVSLVDGIEQFQVEYGVDANDDGYPENPFVTADAVTAGVVVAGVADWDKIVAIRVFVLSRSLTERPEYPVDAKTYVMSSGGASIGPLGGNYRRQLMSSVLQLGNISNWRESN